MKNKNFTTQKMRSILFYKFGPPSVLQLVETPLPIVEANQVLMKVKAAGLNPIDYKTRNGSGFVAKKLILPSSLGYDFAGEVIAIGREIMDVKKGDHLFGSAGYLYHPCCYAEYLCTTPETLAKKPNSVSFLEVAALPTAGLTALQTIKKANIKKGDRVLIQAGAGGVGHLAIQLSKIKGAFVITTASASNHTFLKQLGADQCIDYHTEDFVTCITEPVDAVIDLVGGETGIRSIEVLSENGLLITLPTITAETVVHEALKKGHKAVGLVKQNNKEELSYLAELMSLGKLKVEIAHIFALEEAIRAHEILERGHVCGKLVFKI